MNTMLIQTRKSFIIKMMLVSLVVSVWHGCIPGFYTHIESLSPTRYLIAVSLAIGIFPFAAPFACARYYTYKMRGQDAVEMGLVGWFTNLTLIVSFVTAINMGMTMKGLDALPELSVVMLLIAGLAFYQFIARTRMWINDTAHHTTY